RDGDQKILLDREVLVECPDGHLRALDDVLNSEVGRGLLLQESRGGCHEAVAPRMGGGARPRGGPAPGGGGGGEPIARTDPCSDVAMQEWPRPRARRPPSPLVCPP